MQNIDTEQAMVELYTTRLAGSYISLCPACLSLILMAVDFSRTQQGYAVHLFSIYTASTKLSIYLVLLAAFANQNSEIILPSNTY